MTVKIDYELCTGCKKCYEVCPLDIIAWDKEESKPYLAYPDECQLCPWDCGGSYDGQVSVVDFLALLAQWGQVDTSCDLSLGDPGAGINEFLTILAHWGPCP